MPFSLDQLARSTGFERELVAFVLAQEVAAGRVVRVEGGLFEIVAAAFPRLDARGAGGTAGARRQLG